MITISTGKTTYTFSDAQVEKLAHLNGYQKRIMGQKEDGKPPRRINNPESADEYAAKIIAKTFLTVLATQEIKELNFAEIEEAVLGKKDYAMIRDSFKKN